MSNEKEILFKKIEILEDKEIKGLFFIGINALDNPTQKAIVTGALQKLKNQMRDRNYPNRNYLIDILIEFSNYIYNSDRSNHIYLEKLCEFLGLKKGNEDKIISKIKEYLGRVPKENIDQNSIDFLTVTLASAYASKGDNSQAIKELESINSNSTRVLDNLARLYYYNNQPQKAIELLKDITELNEPMAFWLSKNYYSLGEKRKALDVLKPFSDTDRSKKFIKQISAGVTVDIPKGGGSVGSVFLSYSFNDQDKELVSGFIELLKASDIEVITGLKNPIGSLSQSIISKIRDSRVFIVVMTKRDSKVNGKFTTSSWLLEEKGVAIAFEKPCLMLVENEIDNSEIGGMQGDAQRLYFTRNNFTNIVADAIRMTKECINKKTK